MAPTLTFLFLTALKSLSTLRVFGYTAGSKCFSVLDLAFSSIVLYVPA